MRLSRVSSLSYTYTRTFACHGFKRQRNSIYSLLIVRPFSICFIPEFQIFRITYWFLSYVPHTHYKSRWRKLWRKKKKHASFDLCFCDWIYSEDCTKSRLTLYPNILWQKVFGKKKKKFWFLVDVSLLKFIRIILGETFRGNNYHSSQTVWRILSRVKLCKRSLVVIKRL